MNQQAIRRPIEQAIAPAGPLGTGPLTELLAGWSDSAHGTLAQQLARSLRRAVAAGLLADGTRLPAERALAGALSVSRSTVTAALDELRADGTVESRRGGGTRVRSPLALSVAGTRIAEHFRTVPGIDLVAGNAPDAGHLPPVSVDVTDLLDGAAAPGSPPSAYPPCGRRWPTSIGSGGGSPTPSRSTS
ncbi:MAG: GntR family transcriptional regulator, partial [Acidimicrobiia bacterium]